MKTAEKILAFIGIAATIFTLAAVVTHFICAENKKYYPVSKTFIEV